MSFATYTFSNGEAPDFKFFGSRVAAYAYSKKQIEVGADRSEIYEIPGMASAPAALAALRAGGAVLIEARVQKATQQQIIDAEFDELICISDPKAEKKQ